MSDVQATRAALVKMGVRNHAIKDESTYGAYWVTTDLGRIMRAANAYALAAHVEACEKYHDACHACCPYDEPCTCNEFCSCIHSNEYANNVQPQRCGGGWYCDQAKALQKLSS